MILELFYGERNSSIRFSPTCLTFRALLVAAQVRSREVSPVFFSKEPLAIVEFVLVANEGMLANVPQLHALEGFMGEVCPLPTPTLIDDVRVRKRGEMALGDQFWLKGFEFGKHADLLSVWIVGKTSANPSSEEQTLTATVRPFCHCISHTSQLGYRYDPFHHGTWG